MWFLRQNITHKIGLENATLQLERSSNDAHTKVKITLFTVNQTFRKSNIFLSDDEAC